MNCGSTLLKSIQRTKARYYLCPVCKDELPSRLNGVTVTGRGKENELSHCAIERAIQLYHGGNIKEATLEFSASMLSLAQTTPSPNEIPNIARKITNACSLYLPRFPSQEELTYPNNSLIEFDNFVKYTEWMRTNLNERENEEKFILTLQLKDILNKHGEDIEKVKIEKEDAIKLFQDYQDLLLDKLDVLKRSIVGATKGVESMKSHLNDYPDKVSSLEPKIKEKELLLIQYGAKKEVLESSPQYISMLEKTEKYSNLLRQLGVIEIENKIEQLKNSKPIDTDVGSDFECACQYFVKLEVSKFENNENIHILPGVFFSGVAIPGKVTGEFDFLVGRVDDKNEFEILKVFECKNSASAIQTDIKKKIDSFSFFTGNPMDGKTFVQTNYDPANDKNRGKSNSSLVFTTNSFRRFTNIDDIYSNLIYFTLPGPLAFLEPCDFVYKLILQSTFAVGTDEFIKDTYDKLHEMEELISTMQNKQSLYTSLTSMAKRESIVILEPIISFDDSDSES